MNFDPLFLLSVPLPNFIWLWYFLWFSFYLPVYLFIIFMPFLTLTFHTEVSLLFECLCYTTSHLWTVYRYLFSLTKWILIGVLLLWNKEKRKKKKVFSIYLEASSHPKQEECPHQALFPKSTQHLSIKLPEFWIVPMNIYVLSQLIWCIC